MWDETARELARLLAYDGTTDVPHAPVFVACGRHPLTRFGIYKLVRRHTRCLEAVADHPPGRITPHVFRHTTAVHLLEAGVEVNVIRGWLGHATATTASQKPGDYRMRRESQTTSGLSPRFVPGEQQMKP